jgi:lysophospholipase L1-like esterase
MATHAGTWNRKRRRVAFAVLVPLLFAGALESVMAAPTCDADGDGYSKTSRKCGGNDCDDSRSSINPGVLEVCGNGIDDNCSGLVDEGCGGETVCQDGPNATLECTSDFECGMCVSGENEGNPCGSNTDCPPNTGKGSDRGKCEQHACIVSTGVECTDTDGDRFAIDGGECGPFDCDDYDPSSYPGALEVCGDSADNNCDGQVDETCTAVLPGKLAAAGDSITQAFGASCTCNNNFFCLLCLLGGDQPQYSWFDGSSAVVFSVYDHYLDLDGTISADKSAAEDGAKMRDFFEQALTILGQTPLPDHVEVELGGNDLCGRDCIDPSKCSDPVYTDDEWRDSVRAGLDMLVNGLPDGSTIYLLGVPRVQDLRAAGVLKQQEASNVDCEGVWDDYDICTIATKGGLSDYGESLADRLTGIAERQQRYNEILRQVAEDYNSNVDNVNPRHIEVLTDYVDETIVSAVGAFEFSAEDIDGGDCFHPSIQGQRAIADKAAWSNPDLPSP